MPKSSVHDPTMDVIRARVKEADLSLQELGVKMGFPSDTARMSAHQALKAGDPRISTLRRFAKAIDIPIEQLVAEKKKGQPK